MKAEVLLVDGPFDMYLMSYAHHNKEFPLELRITGATKDEAKKQRNFHAAVYRRGVVEAAPVSLLYFARYDFVGMRPTRHTLIDVYLK